MSIADLVMFAWVLLLGAHYFATMRKVERARQALSPADEAVALCVVKLREAERWAPPGSGFTVTGTKLIRVQGELFRMSVRRAEESAEA